jgi:hypothetical protein
MDIPLPTHNSLHRDKTEIATMLIIRAHQIGYVCYRQIQTTMVKPGTLSDQGCYFKRNALLLNLKISHK